MPNPGGRREPAAPAASPSHERFMVLALEEARAALRAGEVPIGAVIVKGGEVIASGFNRPISSVDPVAHAEIVALRRGAQALRNYRLTGTTLYVTLEPCLMCAGALVSARVSTLVYGCEEPKFGAIRSILDLDSLKLTHRFEVRSGVLAEECRKLLVDFFKFRREQP